MSEDIEQTQPMLKKKARSFRGRAILVTLLVILLAGLGGYQAGLGVRRSAEATIVARQLGEQFQLAEADMIAGRYDVARQRLEFILENDPNYPGAVDLLAQVELKSHITPSPTLTLTPSPSPTPDLSGAESIYARVQELMAAQDWENAIYALDELRKTSPDYQPVKVDGLYYMALRNAGIDRMMARGELENGLYYLTQAERFGPLDGYAEGVREGARLYLTGASFWELDWAQAVYYFEQVYRIWPNIWDSASGYTAADRYRIASLRYADLLANQAKWCKAEQYYRNAQAVYNDPQVAPTLEAVYLRCHPPTPTPLPVTPTPTPGAVLPTPTPTP